MAALRLSASSGTTAPGHSPGALPSSTFTRARAARRFDPAETVPTATDEGMRRVGVGSGSGRADVGRDTRCWERVVW